MYTFKRDDIGEDYWILDPDGIVIAVVDYDYEAKALISHLNRE